MRISGSGRVGLLVFMVVLALASFANSARSASENATALTHEARISILVQLRDGASATASDRTLATNGAETLRDLTQIRTKVVSVPITAAPRLLDALAHEPAVLRASRTTTLRRAGDPVVNDPGYAQQWALRRIRWDVAYASQPISGGAIVAVLDTGIDATVTELPITDSASFTGNDPLSDANGHGTALAGIVAANANDARGIAGVAYAGVVLESVQVLRADGTGTDADVVSGVLWAADHGAKVILMGFSSADYSWALADAIAYAWDHGALTIAATGNDASRAYTYPAGMPYVIGVAATDETDAITSSSNTGSASVAAPGANIYTTAPGGAYTTITGTSAAAAHAAGLAGLLMANGATNTAASSQLRSGGVPIDGGLARIDVPASFTADATLAPTAGTPAGGAAAPGYAVASTDTISGVVRDSIGAPIVGATVTCGVADNCNNARSTTTAADGSYTLTVQFGGASTFTVHATAPGCQPVALTQTINGTKGNSTQIANFTGTSALVCATTTTVTSSANPSVFGQSVTFTATVSDTTGGTTTPTGTVTFKDGGTTLGTATLTTASTTSATATFSTSALTVGAHSITAVYAGDATHTASTSAALTQTVNKANTSTTVTSSANPSNSGSSVTFTATVAALAPGAGTPTGTVTFKDGATTLGTGTLSAGVATFSTSSLSVGPHSITASYGGNGSFNTSSGTLTQTVSSPSTTTTVTSSTNPSVFGQSVTFTATVTSAGGTPTGSVQFKADGTPIGGAVTLSAGAASVSTSALGVGARSITADYTSDTTSFTNSSGSLTQTVNKANTSTTVTSNLNPSTFGASVTFTATVAALAPGAGTPGGTVQFKDNGTPIGTPVALSGGTASISTTTLSTGSHTVTADYSGSASFNASTGSLTQSVNKANTTTTVTSSVNPSVFGQSSTFTATVASAGGTPDGSVTFKEGTTVLAGPVALDGTGTASFSTSAVSVGIHTITAEYGGSSSFNASTGSVTQTVNKADTTTSVASTPNPSSFGQSVTFTATVTSGGGTPDGTVLFKEGMTVLAGPVALDAAGKASFSAAALGAASHGITAEYSGASNFNPSSGSTTQVVNKADTTTSVTPTVDPSTFGQSTTFTATVTSGGGTPDGTVVFKDGTTVLAGPVALDATGKASFSTASLGAASHAVSAEYSGASNFNPSSGSTTQVVQKADTTTAVTSNLTPSTYGQSVTFTATVSAVAPGAGTPNGTVQFKVDGTSAGAPVTLDSSGAASFSTSTLSAGSHTIAADYSGSSNFNASTGSAAQSVNAKSVDPSFTANNKIYDGTTGATIATRALTGVVGADDVTLSGGIATFDTKTVGAGKTVTATGFTLTGTTAGNYQLSTTTATTVADITARALTITATGVNKVYDGTTTATVTLSDNRVSGDVFSDAYAAATFADKNVGTAKAVSVSGISISGADAGNYTFNTTASTTANLTARALTVSAHGVNRTYDGTTNATVTLSDDRVSGDVFTDSYTSATFADKNVGTGKTVSVAGIAISGTDAPNYTFNTAASTTADITARALRVSATGVSRVYDGTTTATVKLSDDRVSGDVFTDSYGGAEFSDKNAGTAKPVNVSGLSITGADAGNYTFNTTTSTTADITARALTISAHGINKTYDGTTTATVTLSDDRISGDSLTDSYTAASFSGKNVGTGKAVSVSGISISGADAGNYTFNMTASTTADITARALTISATGQNKTYDGTTAATVTLADNKAGGDAVTDSYTAATFADKNVGTGKTVTVSGISISGTDAGNYTFNTTATTTADITTRALTVSATGVNKTYDGTTAATVTLSDDRVSGDVFTDNYTSATFASKNVGTGTTVSVSGISISGTDAGNYTFNATASTTADITAKALTISATGVNRTYDGTATATVTLSDDRVSGDVFTDSYTTATFADKNVGTGKAVSVSGISISGTDAGNYSFNTTASTTADITARTLTISATGVNRSYDGSTTATVTLSDDRVAGDVFNDTYSSATFADKNVGTGKTVSVSGISISGIDAGNYTFNTTASTTANISARTLSVSATGVNRIYDGSTTASVFLSDDRVAGDVFSDAYTAASFGDKNVGTGKTVSVSGISVSGTDAGNYTFNTATSTTADITARALTVSAHGINKNYDGTTTATVTLTDDRVSGDLFTDSYTSATFASKNVGTGKTVSVSGISISGTDAGNYTFNATASTIADITAKALTITAHGVDKTYDGNTTATVTLTDDRVAGDTFTSSYASASFADKNVGTGKTVNVTGLAISGIDAGNYTFNTTASTTANITARALTVSATGVNRTYDGTATATVGLSDDRVSGDVFTDSYTTATFADKNVGTSKAVSVNGISISGADAGNYTFNTTASTTADITARALAITAHGVNKTYDGTTTATVTLSDDRISGDSLTDSYSVASFSDKNVGTAKTVNVTGISISGTNAGNYVANTTASTTADITARTLTISATGANKTYDGTATATVTLSDDRVSGDSFTDSYSSATFANKNVGTAKAVSVNGISISGTDAANYAANTTATTTADITARALTVSATGVDKTYDGTNAATVTLSDNKLSGDAVTDAYTTATFSDKNVGTGKTVNVSGISISGSDAGNYTSNATATTTASITARALTVSAAGINKTYDGSTTATVTLSDDRVAGDIFTDAYTAAGFTDKNVGTGKTVNVSGISITGADAGNYTFNTTASTAADITARALTISAHGVNRTYDGLTTATVTLSDNRVSGDVFTDAYTAASFADKNVGTGKTVSVSSLSISGTDAGNYTFNTAASTTADISARALTISAHGVNKTYDGSTAATVNLTDDRVSGDVFSDSYASATFADKNVGAGKLVTVAGIAISGTDAPNYTFNATGSTTADIGARALTITAIGVSKTYDGTTAATVTLSDNRVAGDVFTDAYTAASFSDKNVGTAKAVSVSGISISGTDAGNYTANTSASTTADIMARALNIAAHGVNKTYDGGTAATVTLSDNRVSGDVLTDAYTAASFADKNVGTGKAVSVSGITISGIDAGNYTFNNAASTTANITARALTITATGVNKVYDGTTTGTVTLGDDRVAGDVFTDAYTAARFADKNVGTGKGVSVSGITISGTDAGNYTNNTTATTTASITARALTAAAHGVNKTYDGTTAATVTLSDDRVAGDVFTDNYGSATFADKNVGSGKTVAVSGISISGTDAGNYTSNTTASTTADISARALLVTATGVNKVYDGTTTATVALSDDRVSGDAFTDSYTSATFADKNVGTGKTVSVSGIAISGTDAGNYTFNTTATTIANITARPITVAADDQTKTIGTSDPPLTYRVTSGSLASGDAFSGALTRDAGETVGTYTIHQGTLTAGADYTLTFVEGHLTIQRNATLTYTGDYYAFTSTNPNLGTLVDQRASFTGTPFVDYSSTPVWARFQLAGPTTRTVWFQVANGATWTTTGLGTASGTTTPLLAGTYTVTVDLVTGNGSSAPNAYIVAPAIQVTLVVSATPASGSSIIGSGSITPDSSANTATKAGSYSHSVSFTTSGLSGSVTYRYLVNLNVGTDASPNFHNVWITMASTSLTYMGETPTGTGTATGIVSGLATVKYTDQSTGASYSQFDQAAARFIMSATDNGATGDRYAIAIRYADGTLFHASTLPYDATTGTATKVIITSGSIAIR